MLTGLPVNFSPILPPPIILGDDIGSSPRPQCRWLIANCGRAGGLISDEIHGESGESIRALAALERAKQVSTIGWSDRGRAFGSQGANR